MIIMTIIFSAFKKPAYRNGYSSSYHESVRIIKVVIIYISNFVVLSTAVVSTYRVGLTTPTQRDRTCNPNRSIGGSSAADRE
jgi:hypothetical protein